MKPQQALEMSQSSIVQKRGPFLWSLGLSIGLVLPLLGCGSSNSPTGPTTPGTTTLLSATFSNIVAGGGAFQDFMIPDAGTITAKADWTFSTNDMDLVLTTPACTFEALLTTTTCTILGQDISKSSKPATFTATIPQSSTARVFVVNFGPDSESGTVQVTLTR